MYIYRLYVQMQYGLRFEVVNHAGDFTSTHVYCLSTVESKL